MAASITKGNAMKIRNGLTGLVLLGAFSLAQADAGSRIARVTLYPGSAAIERVAQVAAGDKRLEITGLPANFDPNTLRVEAGAGIRVGELVVQDISRSDAAGEREAAIEARIQALSDKLAQLDAGRKSAELVTGYLQGLGAPTSAGKPAAADGKALTTMLEAIQRGGNEAFARIQQVEVQKRELERQRQVLQAELQKVRSGARDQRHLSIGLAAERAGEVRVSYLVNGPGWRPSYRAALDSGAARVELERLAQVAQNSGEDWNKVALKLSTGQPRQSPRGAELRPWKLVLVKPQPLRARAEPLPLMAAPMAKMMESAEAGTAPIFEVNEIQGSFATEFEVPGQVSVPADGRKLTFSLGHQSLAVKLRVQAAPRQDTNAYLVAEGERPAGVWLPGEIQLLRDGSHIGATQWDARQNERLELPFGRDALLRISVAHPLEMSADSGFLSQKSERRIADVYSVENLHKQAVNLLLLEASPVATDESIRVEARFEPRPSQENHADRPGVMAWEKVLAPGEKQKFSVDYRIAWPKDSRINGLP